jgi:steroid delta-isomerase-like uncharacterized protein
MGAEQLRDVSHRWMDGWNRKDADALIQLVTDDLVYYDPSWPELIRGPEGVRAFTAAMWRAMPDMRFEEPFGLFHAEEGERAAAPWRMTATFSGPMEPPGFAPTGDRIEVEGVDVFELRDGKVARLWTHYDAMEIARRLGVLPPRGSAAERAGAKLQGLMAARRRRRN